MSATASRRARMAALVVCALVASALVAGAAGCKNGAFQPPPNATTATGNVALPQQAQALATQVQDLNRRVAQLDLNNADLHRQLAQKAQQETAAQEQVKLLQQELGTIAQRYKDTQLAQQEAQQKVSALEASTRFRGGASISSSFSTARQ